MGRRRGRGRAGATAIAAAALAAAGAAAYGFGLPTGDADAGSAAGPAATAEITRRTLVEAVTSSGDLGYGAAVDAACLLEGIVTGLPAPEDEIGRGGELFAVDDRPVVLLYGPLPAYRTLRPGLEGRDVEQFERNLAELGYGGFTADDEYTYKTAAAVKEWQDDLGLEKTGEVELGRVVYADGKIRVDAVTAEIGDRAAGDALLSYSGPDQVVTAELAIEDRDSAVVGEPVELTLPDGTAATGTVTGTETVTDGGDDEDPGGETETVVKVTVAADDRSAFDGFEQASVTVAFPGAVAEDVLAVPVAALLALAEGGYGLELVDGGTGRVVAVETGLFADGLVEVSGEDLAEGMTVGVPS